jgi:transcriptional regulator with XRE-family HTH domain
MGRLKKVDRQALRNELVERASRADLTVPEAIRMARHVAAKTQPEFARLVGVSVRVLRELERGTGNPTLGTLEKIFAPFQLEVAVRLRGARRDSEGA